MYFLRAFVRVPRLLALLRTTSNALGSGEQCRTKPVDEIDTTPAVFFVASGVLVNTEHDKARASLCML
jgi:hypothetical protein